MTLTDLCQELKNWFDLKRVFGTFTISGGEISLDCLQENQYYRIIGSTFNDGVHRKGYGGLEDETFEGAVWLMGIPPAVIKLLDEINKWQEQYGAAVMSPYNSESFGGYSYTKAYGTSGGSGANKIFDYKTAFADQLNRWRKV